MPKTLSTKLAKPRKDGVKVGSGSKAGRNRSKIDGNEVDNGKIEDDEVGKKVQKMFKSKSLF